MKKVFFISFLFLFFIISPVFAGGVNCPTEGLVPCGTEGCPCELCDFFVMIDRILDFVLIKIVPVIAVLMLVVGGLMFFFSGGSPTTASNAKRLITATVIGLVVIFAAFLLVGMILSFIGLADWTQDFYRTWWQEGFFQINCE